MGLEGAHELAELFELKPVQVWEVLSFYNMFYTEPQGRHHVYVCTNLPCSLRGARGILRELEKHLGIHAGETTSDGRVTLGHEECLGSCGTAPVLRVAGGYREGGALTSACRHYHDRGHFYRAAGNALIAFGALLTGIGGSYAKAGNVEVLSMAERLGLLLIWMSERVCSRQELPRDEPAAGSKQIVLCDLLQQELDEGQGPALAILVGRAGEDDVKGSAEPGKPLHDVSPADLRLPRRRAASG